MALQDINSTTACNIEIDNFLPENTGEYKERQKLAEDFLNGVDVASYCTVGQSIYDIMMKIEQEHGNEFSNKYAIFHCISPDDFLYYIRSRYREKIVFKPYSDIKVYSNNT